MKGLEVKKPSENLSNRAELIQKGRNRCHRLIWAEATFYSRRMKIQRIKEADYMVEGSGLRYPEEK